MCFGGRWYIVDPTGVYGSSTVSATVADGEVSSGLSSVLALAPADTTTDDTAETSIDDTTDIERTSDADTTDTSDINVTAADSPTGVSADESARANPEPVRSIEVSYSASFTGVVQDIATALPLWPVQVCAVQPHVLHQSCATTNEAGEFTIEVLSAGNYRLTAVDGLGGYISNDSTPRWFAVGQLSSERCCYPAAGS